MFKFFKDKLRDAVNKFSKKAEEDSEEQVIEEIEEVVEEPKEDKKPEPVKEKIKPVKEIKEEKSEPIKEIKKPEIEEIIEKKEVKELMPKKKSFFESITEKVITKKINEEQFDELFWELELVLMENNVASEVIEKIKQDLKMDLVDQPIKRGDILNTIKDSLKKSIEDVLDFDKIDLVQKIKGSEKPFVMVFFGINGSGKTTTIAKVANKLSKSGKKCLLVAADTFRAAAIQQLEEHGKNLGLKVIKHDYGADPAAVAFDGVKSAKARGYDVVLIDTAGRQHSNENLIEEMKKIVKVVKPNMKIFVGESITGNDCIEQVKKFNSAVKIDAIVLSKSDVDEKGGTALSISFVSGKPILYFGVGQNYDDIKEFDKEYVMKNLGF